MAYHNNTPMSILTAPKSTHEFVEGTEFSGTNRQRARAFATLEGHSKKSGSSMKKSDHWLPAVLAEKRAKAYKAYREMLNERAARWDAAHSK